MTSLFTALDPGHVPQVDDTPRLGRPAFKAHCSCGWRSGEVRTTWLGACMDNDRHQESLAPPLPPQPIKGSVVLLHGEEGTAWQRLYSTGRWVSGTASTPLTWSALCALSDTRPPITIHVPED